MSRQNRTGVFELPENPQLSDLFKVFGRKLRLSLHTNTVGTVQTYYPADQTADVRIDILAVMKALISDTPGEDVNLINAYDYVDPIVLMRIPVVTPRGSSGYLSFPIKNGTTGELVIHERGIQTWLNRKDDLFVDSFQSATHALHDATFHPGLTPNKDRIAQPTDLTATVLHDDNAIKLGRNATLGVARLTDKTIADTSMQVFINQVVTAISQIAVVLNAPGPVVGAPGTVTPAIPPTDFGVINTASSKSSSE